jgi:inner membrane protein
VAIFTHPLLDWTTSYGTRLLTPLTDTRFTIDSAPIVDLIYTSLLVITLATCYVVRRVRGGHARKATLAIGWTGVMLTVAYLAAGRAMHDWAVRKALTHDPAGKVLAVNAYPMIGTIFLWRTVMETDQAWIVARFHHFDDRPPEQIPRRRVEKQAPARWVEQVMDLPAGRTWNWFTNGQVRWEQRQVDGVHVVEMHDMRYGPSPGSAESLWWLRVEFDSAGEVQRVTRERHFREGDFGELVRRLWRDIWQPRNPEPETLSALMISRDDAKDLPHANPAR